MLAQSFAAEGVRQGESCVLLTFEEPPEDYSERAQGFGWDFGRWEREGKLAFVFRRPMDLTVDEVIDDPRKAVERTGARRLVLDSISGFELARAPADQSNFREALYRLASWLTSEGVTVLMTTEIEEIFGEIKFSTHQISFEEPVEQLVASARNLAPDVDDLLKSGALAILHMSPLETDINEQIIKVREAIGNGTVKRLVFDSLSNYEDLLSEVEYKDYVYSLLLFIKSSGVTALLTTEIRELTVVERITTYGTSYLLDNIIMLRYVELANTLRRAIIVLKTRGGGHANDIREYVIARGGIQVLPIDPSTAVPVLSLQQYSHILTAFPAPRGHGEQEKSGKRQGKKTGNP
ncbi:MAG: hypothetical protein HYY30_06245 [Chloroflexi bacterium]|nr:hypothetical protein [Chloroflexota bacterium]